MAKAKIPEPPYSTKSVASRLEWLRKRHKLTQTAFAKSIGVTSNRYNNWITGRQRLPLASALEIAEVYKVGLDFLYLNRAASLPADLLISHNEAATG